MSTSPTRAVKASRVATVIIFLALIRCISEVFRLAYYAPGAFTYTLITPFLLGALICAVALLAMSVLSFYSIYKPITVIAILTVVSLMVLKYYYSL